MGDGLLSSTGFDPKRLDDVIADLNTAMRAEFGQAMNLGADTPEGKLVGVWGAALTDIWERLEAVHQASYPGGASGVSLDRVAEITGINRADAFRSTGTVYLRGTGATVPSGSLVSVEDDGDQFRTLSEVIIPAGGSIPVSGTTGIAITSITRVGTVASVITTAVHGLPAGAVVTISGANESQYNVTAEIENIGASTFDYNMVSDPGGSATGTITYGDEKIASDHLLLTNVTARSTAVHGLTTGDIIAVFNVDQDGYNGFFSCTVLDTTHVQYTPIIAITITPGTGVSARLTSTVSVLVKSVDLGAIVGNAGTLIVIDTPVSGWEGVGNITNVVLGADEETDAAFRTRRLAALQGLGNATTDAIRGDLLSVDNVIAVTVFENDTGFTDSGGRPLKSIECLVQGGDDADIAQAIWDSKAGGIETFGTSSDVATDSQGNPQTMNFSRPFDINIYLDITLTVDGDYPADGDAQVETAVLAWAATLLIGDDVIVYPYLVGSFDDIPGLLTVVIDIGTAPAPSGDANIVIAETEKAVFSAGNTTVTST